jgi:precorrin-6B methylase 2
VATDIAIVLGNLTSFYDFRGKAVVHVGAGGGQFVGYAVNAGRVLAVDPDAAAVAQLQSVIARLGLGDRFAVRQAGFEWVADPADVVFFEFCLHEIEDPAAALAHARTLAPETLVIDHAPDSQWAWHTAESEKAGRSWAAVERAGIQREERFTGWQHFEDADALLQRVASQGEPAVSRARALAGRTKIEIPMIYRVAVL